MMFSSSLVKVAGPVVLAGFFLHGVH